LHATEGKREIKNRTSSKNNPPHTPSAFPPSRWPGGNIFYGTPAIQFVSFGNGIAGDYHLLPGSPAKGAGSDGQDLGANVDAVLGAISAIQ
jgi:hypothetical protein